MTGHGMCGQMSPKTSFGGQERCVLESGHDGWHESAPLMTERFGVIEPLKWTSVGDQPRPRWDHATLDELVRRRNSFTASWGECIDEMRAEVQQ